MEKREPDPSALAERAARAMRCICDLGWSISTAESCTGGLVAALLTDIEGCSHAFDRGFVTYSESAKTEMLGVEPDLLRERGAVSREVAVAMAKGCLGRSSSDIALSVTGFAGPSGPEDEEGLVHFVLLKRDGALRHRALQFGPKGRDMIRQLCLFTILEMLEEDLSGS